MDEMGSAAGGRDETEDEDEDDESNTVTGTRGQAGRGI